MEEIPLAELTGTEMPPPLVRTSDVLQINVMLEDGKIPYKALDTLRQDNGIDVTSLTHSMTHGGNIYRSYVLHGVSSTK